MTSRIFCGGTSTGSISAPSCARRSSSAPTSSGSAIATVTTSFSLRDHQQAVLLGEVDRHVRDQLEVDLVGLQLGAIGDAELLAQRVQHLLLGDRAHPHQDLAEAPALGGLHLQPLLEKRGGQTRARGRFRLQQNLSNQFRGQVLSVLPTVTAARSRAAATRRVATRRVAAAASPAVAAARSMVLRWVERWAAAAAWCREARRPAAARSARQAATATRPRPSDRSPASRGCPAQPDPLPRPRARRG